ncbi:MAG: hypothetical protein J7500_12935 [Sphingomonas sp.]|uniref:hypothetical protein n=1 Tax=Sphingomonas sp. TaxID=28214 RepID=UPI001B1FBFD1|nr:hypothetical protein [Sphingomonas sp.]MBO9623607.1 hypothetical protein [Sphingomonas sp.]
MIDHYDWAGGREAMLRFGPDTGPVVVAALPLFEEANRTRALVVTMLRALAERGIASALPDLPGQGESVVPTEEVTLADWQEAFGAAAAWLGNPHTVAIRGGALVTLGARRKSSWVFAPVDGSTLVRDLQRARQITQPNAPLLIDLATTAPAGTRTEAAGTGLSVDLLHPLVHAIPDRATPNRLTRLESDPGEANAKFPGAPLWRRAEPGNDPTLAELLADDIAAWVRSCEG